MSETRKPLRHLFAAVHAPDWLRLGNRLERALTCGIVGLDIRLVNPAEGPSKAEAALAAIASECAIEVRCHAWAGVRAPDGTSKAVAADGTRQGRALALAAAKISATIASGNFERDVWRGPNGCANPKAVDFIDAYIDAAHAAVPGMRVGDLGFADPDEHYRDADLDHDGDIDDELPEHVVNQFARRGLMAYQNTPEAVRAKLAKGRAIAGSVPCSWWGSVGRVEKDGTVIGDAATTRAIWEDRPSAIDEWVGYVGFGAIGQVLDGHARHPALADMVRTWRTAS